MTPDEQLQSLSKNFSQVRDKNSFLGVGPSIQKLQKLPNDEYYYS
jgi:hypothetical protein